MIPAIGALEFHGMIQWLFFLWEGVGDVPFLQHCCLGFRAKTEESVNLGSGVWDFCLRAWDSSAAV